MMAMVYDFHFPREFSSLVLCLGGGADKLRQPRSQQAHEYHYGKTILLFANSSFLLPSLYKSIMVYSKHPYCRRPKIHFSISSNRTCCRTPIGWKTVWTRRLSPLKHLFKMTMLQYIKLEHGMLTVSKWVTELQLEWSMLEWKMFKLCGRTIANTRSKVPSWLSAKVSFIRKWAGWVSSRPASGSHRCQVEWRIRYWTITRCVYRFVAGSLR